MSWLTGEKIARESVGSRDRLVLVEVQKVGVKAGVHKECAGSDGCSSHSSHEQKTAA